jgi:hypothetical protein
VKSKRIEVTIAGDASHLEAALERLERRRTRWYQRLCPHWFGWSYNTHRRRRWCMLCAQQQRQVEELRPGDRATFAMNDEVWIDV